MIFKTFMLMDYIPSTHGHMGRIWAESGHDAQIGPMWVPYRNFSPCGTHIGPLLVIIIFTYLKNVLVKENVCKLNTCFFTKAISLHKKV